MGETVAALGGSKDFVGSLGAHLCDAAPCAVLLLLPPPLVLVLLLELHGRPDPGEILAGYLGLLLVGSMYLAGGLLASTIAGSQTIAYLLSVFFFILVSLSRTALPAWIGPDAWETLSIFDPFHRMEDFTIGLKRLLDPS